MMAELTRTLTRDGRWIPLLFVAFFLVVFAANGAMVAVAVSTWTGVTTDTHYRDGVEYNDRLEAAADQAKLGWTVEVASEDAGPRRVDFSVGVTGPDGEALSPDDVSVVFWRPTHQGFDRTETLHPTGEGRYGAEIALPIAGIWDARITLHRGGHRYQTTKRIFVEP
jgi:nitrogen fixation protein FixH